MAQTREFDCFVGIDLGGGKGKNTGVALLRRASGGVRVSYVGTKSPEGVPFYDTPLLEFIRERCRNGLLAIDAPLLPTVCVRCRLPTCVGLDRCEDPVIQWFRAEASRRGEHALSGGPAKPSMTPYTQRACEVVLKREHGILPRETLGQGMGPLTARAHYLSRALEGDFELNRNMIEVYPKATLHMLFGEEIASRYKRQVHTWRTRAQILEALAGCLKFEVWREGCLSNDHCFDAVVSAYTGYLWATGNWTLPEQDADIFRQDGWIWVPPKADAV